MSQRGSLLDGAKKNMPIMVWAYMRNIVGFTLALTLGTTLTVTAQDTQLSKMVMLCVDGQQRQVSTQKVTVQTLLHQEGIMLNTYDRCEPPITTAITEGMTITIIRVTCETVAKRVEIPAPTVERFERRFSDTPVVLRQGRPGVAVEKSIIWKKDGVVSAQWVQSTKVVKKPTKTVMLRGSLPSRSGLNVRRVITMESTAYDPGPLSCGPNCTGRTKLGLKATKGIVAVDPRVIPLGTRVFVDGYGEALAADVGGAIKGNRIDVCFDSRREALNWGRRTVQVMILE